MFEAKIKSKFKILDFDIECRPLSWYGGDFVTKDITAIAAKWIGEGEVFCWLLKPGKTIENALDNFVELYNEAGMVTGHYIRGYDLSILNSALTEYGRPPLSSKLSHDTKLDLIKRQGMSNSQENLAAMLGVEHPKVGMTQKEWRSANRLEREGIEATRNRVIGDVLQHEEMRQKLLELKMLGPPKIWNSVSSTINTTYTP